MRTAIAFALIALSSLTLWSCDDASNASNEPLRPDLGLDALSIPEFTLVDQNGQERTRELFAQGDLVVMDFFFSSCPFICPPMGQNMAWAQEQLEGEPVRFVSISVDPERDTPERLREYADSIGADLSTWTFLTGDYEQVERICRDGLLLAIGGPDDRKIPLPDGGEMNNIPHSSRFIVIGPDGQPIGLYSGIDRPDVERMVNRLKAAADELEDL